MTKRNFKGPGLQHKNKWSENFHDFLRYALQKDPKRRPTAAELLKVRRMKVVAPTMAWCAFLGSTQDELLRS